MPRGVMQKRRERTRRVGICKIAESATLVACVFSGRRAKTSRNGSVRHAAVIAIHDIDKKKLNE